MTDWQKLTVMHRSPLGATHSGSKEDCISAQCGPDGFALLANGGKVEDLPPIGLDGPCVFPHKTVSRDTVKVELDQSEAASVVDALISAADARRDKKGRLHEVIADYLDDLALRIHNARGVSEGRP